MEGPGVAPGASEGVEVDLFPSAALERGLSLWRAGQGGEGKESPRGGDEEGPEAERARVSARVEGDLERTRSTSRVQNGMYDPYFQRLARSFKQEWKPEAAEIDGSGDGALGHVGSFLRHWSNAGRQYAATGNPMAPGKAPAPSARAATRPGNGSSGIDLSEFRSQWNSGDFGSGGALVLVRLEQDADGLPLRIEILESSGIASLDTSALAAVREEAPRHKPPAHGLGLGAPVIQTVWKFHAQVVSNTCVPVLDESGANMGSLGNVVGLGCGGTFDPSLGTVHAELPFERKIITAVQLIALIGGETQPHEP